MRSLEKYRVKILTADKNTLLEELCEFHEMIHEYPESRDLLMKGHCLVEALKSRALTENLHDLVIELEGRLETEVETELRDFT